MFCSSSFKSSNNLIKSFCTLIRPLSERYRDKEDLKLFCKLANEGKLYEGLKTKLGLKDRDEGKAIAFKLFFGNIQKEERVFEDSKKKALLREHFPTVVEIVELFKTHCIKKEKTSYEKNTDGYKLINLKKCYGQVGSSKFAIMLQNYESYIFIDEILQELLDEGHLVLSIHDSFLFTDERVEKLIRIKLNQHLPHGHHLKSSYP